MSLITIVGMGKGISHAVAQRFAREGFTVAMIARDEAKLKQFQAELGASTHYFVADAGNESSLKSAFEAIRTQLGETDVLLYNAVLFQVATPSQIPYDDLIHSFKVNIAGALVAAQAVIPAMRARKTGTILFTGGGLALQPHPNYAAVSVGKAGIRNLALSLAQELQPDGIYVGTITICGFVQPDDPKYNPTAIAEHWWNMYQTQPQTEIVY